VSRGKQDEDPSPLSGHDAPHLARHTELRPRGVPVCGGDAGPCRSVAQRLASWFLKDDALVLHTFGSSAAGTRQQVGPTGVRSGLPGTSSSAARGRNWPCAHPVPINLQQVVECRFGLDEPARRLCESTASVKVDLAHDDLLEWVGPSLEIAHARLLRAGAAREESHARPKGGPWTLRILRGSPL
jgi:hypothetical protein